ncbi:hypothetical protein [Pseudoalteromonas sp. XMcav11-Q]|uniref:hypothetical protein n=1 Tax=Pseudoalteromonas sp. XMcav11-Q TaxID=3136665 RepID=UPI0032C3EB58
MEKVKGIALIQVLIISLVLSLLGIFILQTGQEQVKTSSQIKKSFELRLQLESTEALLTNALLTAPNYNDPNNVNEIATIWNFHGSVFKINGVEVSIQDLGGLISLNTTGGDLIGDFLVYMGSEQAQAKEFVDSLRDWKDEDSRVFRQGAESEYYRNSNLKGVRNGYLQSLGEVLHIKGAKKNRLDKLLQYFTVEHVSGFNPLNAPKEVMASFVKNKSTVEKLLELRDNGQLSANVFYKYTGFSSGESLTFSTGNLLRITMRVKSDDQTLSKQFIVNLRVRSKHRPFVMTDVSWNLE